LEPKEPKLA